MDIYTYELACGHTQDRVSRPHNAINFHTTCPTCNKWVKIVKLLEVELTADIEPLPIHRTEAGYPNCSTCDGGGCLDCTDPA